MSVIGPIQTCHFRHEASITSDVNDVRVVDKQLLHHINNTQPPTACNNIVQYRTIQ